MLLNVVKPATLAHNAVALLWKQPFILSSSRDCCSKREVNSECTMLVFVGDKWRFWNRQKLTEHASVIGPYSIAVLDKFEDVAGKTKGQALGVELRVYYCTLLVYMFRGMARNFRVLPVVQDKHVG